MWLLMAVALAALSLGGASPVLAQASLDEEIGILKIQVAGQAEALEEARRRNEQLEQRLRALEQHSARHGGGATDGGTVTTPAAQSEPRIDELEAAVAANTAQSVGVMERIASATEVNGYFQFEYVDFQDSDSKLDAQNIELVIKSAPAPRLTVFAEIEFERTAKTSGDDDPRQGDVEVEQAWMQYALTPWLNPRAGAVVVPFGRYNIDHFAVVQDFVERPLVASRVVPVTWSEAGIGSVGSLSLGNLGVNGEWPLRLGYEAYLINGLTDRITDTSTRNARGAFGSDNNNDKALVARLALSSLAAFELGLSGYGGAYDPDGNDDIVGFDVDWDFRRGPFHLKGEYASFDLDDGANSDGEQVPDDLRGGYVEGTYSFWPPVLERYVGRYFSNPQLTTGARWGFAEIGDGGDADTGDNREERLTLGINLRPTRGLVVKLDWVRSISSGEAIEHGAKDGFIAAIAGAF